MEQNKAADTEPIVKELTIEEMKERLTFLEGESRKAFTARDKAKQEKRELETSLDETNKAKDAELLKVKDYETLNKKLIDKASLYEKQQSKLKEKVIEITLKQLASEYKIKKSDYIALMKVDVKVDDELNVNDIDEIKKKIESFKKENPDLFNSDEEKKVEDKKITPSTDKKGPADVKVRLNIQDRINEALKNRK